MTTSSNSKLNNIKLVFGIMDEYEDCTYCHAIVYSYLLCKYSWFSKQNKEYFESQETIAESCRSKYGSVRGSIRWLESKGLVKVTKIKTKQHNKNAYIVEDRYAEYSTGVYSKPKESSYEAPRKKPLEYDPLRELPF